MKRLCSIIIYTCCFNLLNAQVSEGTKKKERLKTIGNIGASANFYKSNENDSFRTRPPYSWNVYGSLVVKGKDFSLPISFVLNQYGSNGNRSPYLQIGLSPTYKWAKLHLGYRSIPLSPLIFEGQSFKGVGIELNPKLFRFAAFYGSLNKRIRENTNFSNSSSSQYSRLGYGVKVGIGSQDVFLDVIYFHAKDDSTTSNPRNALAAQENSVLGSSFKITVAKKLVLTGDMAVSGLTQDQSFFKLNADSIKIVKDVISKLIAYNVSTVVGYAGQSSLSFNTRGFNTNVGYRRVQPDFKSLGTPYVVNDVELISWNNNFSVAKGKLNVGANFSNQHNNLNKKLRSELRTEFANINVNTILGTHVTINLNYSGYGIKQNDGKSKIEDSVRLQQRATQWSVNPGYNITKGTKIHFIYGNVNLSQLKDQNRFLIKPTNTTCISSSLNYTLAFTNKPYNFSLNGVYSKYEQADNSYRSYGANIGTATQLLKNKNLNIQGNVGYFFNIFNFGSRQKNITYSITSMYQVKRHSLNVSVNYVYTPRNAITEAINKAINQSIPSAVATRNLATNITYNYTL